ncbi:hypothetical protein AB0B57_32315 [Micromonospora sp. NPDC049101]
MTSPTLPGEGTSLVDHEVVVPVGHGDWRFVTHHNSMIDEAT